MCFMQQMRVMGSHLSAACKLVFKVARNDKTIICSRTAIYLVSLQILPDTQASYATGAVNGSVTSTISFDTFSYEALLTPYFGTKGLYFSARLLLAVSGPRRYIVNAACTEREHSASSLWSQNYVRAQHAGALHLAALHLKIINTAKRDKGSVSEESIHALYQVTGALRNLLGSGGGEACEAQAILASGALPELIAALPLYVTDRDVLTNVVRCLRSV
ncbi:hypothetical protein EVAR_102179_1 [Eumeta japonica]|uniref:Uncharacterized protein n=1 Tax=Eumeta variegata TaxID=151549 RepID=A0A4C1ZCW2_EUMVA|nr:hypothetical protein EVAR_102179_1 [Eumeta japonica]